MNKEKSKLIKQLQKDAETQLSQISNAQQGFYICINNCLENLKNVYASCSDKIVLTRDRELINGSLSRIRKEIDYLDNYYQKQLKPFLDEENAN